MPPPEGPAQAFLIGIVLLNRESSWAAARSSARCFTLEFMDRAVPAAGGAFREAIGRLMTESRG